MLDTKKASTTHDYYSHADKTGGFNLANIFEKTLTNAEVDPEKFKDATVIAAQLLDKIGQIII